MKIRPQDKLDQFLRRKWLVRSVIAGLIVILFYLATALPRRPAPEIEGALPTPTNVPVPTTAFTPEQLQAIAEQRASDESVGKREVAIKTKYPWFIKLPLRGEKYFVYFDQNEAKFVGLLYPKTSENDNVEDLKAEVIRRLRDEIKIVNVDTYPFEWKITPE